MENKDYWKETFTRYINSNISIVKFCAKEKISTHQFKYYRQLLELDGFRFDAHGFISKEYMKSKSEYWKLVFEDFIKSNLSIKQYCNINGISRDSFRYWKDKLLLSENYSFSSPYEPIHDPIKKQNSNFIEFNLKDIETDEISKSFKLNLDGISLTIDSKQNKYFIIKLIKELQGLL